MKRIIVGCCQNSLIVTYIKRILNKLAKYKKNLYFEIVIINDIKEINKKVKIPNIKNIRFYAKEIIKMLIKGKIDMAVLSAKDLPYEILDNLEVAAITKSINLRNALILLNRFFKFAKGNNIFKILPVGNKVITNNKRIKVRTKKVLNETAIKYMARKFGKEFKLIGRNEANGTIIDVSRLIGFELNEGISSSSSEMHPLEGRLAILIRKRDSWLKNLLSRIDDRKNWGKLFIIGCGPGDKSLLTVKADKILKKVDAILYDELVNKEIVISANSKIKINVGKRKGQHTYQQEEINYKMIKLIENGLNVARLKGGDPSIFANLYSELKYIKSNFINYEIIPGITSATAAACYAEIPLTIKNKYSYTVFSTGYPIKNAFLPTNKFKGTIVYYMCGETLNQIVKKLIRKKWSERTKIFIVSNISLYNQTILDLTFKEFLNSKLDIILPAIAIIGRNLTYYAGQNIWFDLKKRNFIKKNHDHKCTDSAQQFIRYSIS